MTILGVDGRPVISERKVYVMVEVIDRSPGRSTAESAKMGVELDSQDRDLVRKVVYDLSRKIMQRLEQINFFQTDNGPEPGRNHDPHTILPPPGQSPDLARRVVSATSDVRGGEPVSEPGDVT